MSEKKVFISYSHDSDEHREKVLSLSERLRVDGIETLLDQYLNGAPPQGWPHWMLDQLDAADSVLVVCTETYYRRFRGKEEPGRGRGVGWEGALITQEIYASRSRRLKFIPVFLSAANENWIPEPLRAGDYYALTSEAEYRRLYDFLLGQAGVEPQPVGKPKTKPRRRAGVLTFDEPPQTAPTPSPAPRPTPPVSLHQLLIGRWQVEIQPPFAPAVRGQLQIDLFPNGLFRGQLSNLMGVTAVEGHWQANPIQNQIGLQGMQSNGYQTMPYVVMVQVAAFDMQYIQGVTSGGEQVHWKRISAPSLPPPLPQF
jgi:hypothetical protein